MKIVFIGNYQQGPGGETADEVHLASELESLGNTVYRVSRDVWKAYVDGYDPQEDWKLPQEADIAIICKWPHFNDRKYIDQLREITKSPVFYFVWDPMVDDYPQEATGDWHIAMAQAADLYLSGELGRASFYKKNGIRFYYFQFENVSREFLPVQEPEEKKYDVVFLGSPANKRNRLSLLKEINATYPIHIFGYDQVEWIRQGFKKVHPAVYGQEFNKVIADSEIVLGLSYDPHCYGYWSNRVGKVLGAGGFLLQQYTPGMELFLADSCAYFQTAEEAINKIREYKGLPQRRKDIQRNNATLNRSRWTSQFKMRQLMVLIKRYLIEDRGKAWLLP